MDYWNKKFDNASLAREHTDDMEARYRSDIEACAKLSEVFGPEPVQCLSGVQGAHGVLSQTDSVSALFAQPEDAHAVVLNFASFKNPGGMFLNGSSAQEESLCHASFLFNVLSRMQDYYVWNGTHLNRGLYENRAVLSHDVRFFKDGKERLADVLTCAAPNRSCLRYNRFTEDENLSALRSRIGFVASILRRDGYKPDVAILGAFGCGVFSQDAETVARIFREESYPEGLKVVYAVPDERNFCLSKAGFGK